jgi:hypothetical protein
MLSDMFAGENAHVFWAIFTIAQIVGILCGYRFVQWADTHPAARIEAPGWRLGMTLLVQMGVVLVLTGLGVVIHLPLWWP